MKPTAATPLFPVRARLPISLTLRCIAGLLVVGACGCAVQQFPMVRPPQPTTREQHQKMRAEQNFVQALNYDRRGLQQAAEDYYETAYELDPTSTILRDVLVERYVNSGRFTQAILTIKGKRRNEDLSSNDKRLLAKVYIKMGRFDDAAQLIESIADKSADELYSLAFIFESRGNLAKALVYYRKCVELKPDAIELGLRCATLLARAGKTGEAESLYVSLDKRTPNDPRILTGLGDVSMQRGDTAGALNFFTMALLIDSLSEMPLRSAASVYMRRGDYVNAIACYERLYASLPGGAAYGKALALLCYYNNQFDRSMEITQRLLSVDINDPDLHYYLALALSGANHDTLAQVEFEKTLVLAPGSTDAWRQLCFLYLKNKDIDNALSAADRFSNRLPREPAAWRTLGYVQTARKEYVLAIGALQKALSLDSTDATAWFEMGSAYERTKDFAGASRAFLRVLRLRPDDAAAANYLGYMWAEQGVKLDSAGVLLRQALSAEPDNGAYLDSYAWVFHKMGKSDSAFVYISKAAAKIADDATVMEHLGDILAGRGDTDGATRAYQKCLDLKPENAEAVKSKIEAIRGMPLPGAR
jgi:tetratricopeptide (TPR) repeat protein